MALGHGIGNAILVLRAVGGERRHGSSYLVEQGADLGTSENAVRIQVACALIAFLLLRLAQDAQVAVTSPLTFARLVRANLMHPRRLADLAKPPPRTAPVAGQGTLFTR